MRVWLKDARKAKKMTMKDIASKLGISESYYCCIEKGTRQEKMDLVLVGGLSAALGIPVSKIIQMEKEYAESK